MNTCRGSRGKAAVLTFALDECQWSTSRPGRFTPGKESWYPLNRRRGGSQSRSGRFEGGKTLFPVPGFEPQIVQPVT
jgi:hypothetical protein